MTQEFIRSIYGKTDHPGFTVIIGNGERIKIVGTYSEKKIALMVGEEFKGRYDVVVRNELTGEIAR